jgi:hypothetical protein
MIHGPASCSSLLEQLGTVSLLAFTAVQALIHSPDGGPNADFVGMGEGGPGAQHVEPMMLLSCSLLQNVKDHKH